MKILLTTSAVAIVLAAAGGSALADTSDKRIALSNNYAGNSWQVEPAGLSHRRARFR